MNKRLSFVVIILATTLAHFGGNEAFARGKKMRLLPGGIVFPNLNQAADVNAATLKTQKGRSIQALYAPPLDDSQTAHEYTLSVASVSKDFGLGAGYTGTLDGSDMTHGAFVGGGFSTGDLGFGVTLREENLDDTESASLDLGFNYTADKSFQFGAVVKNVTSDDRTVVVGFGYEKRGTFNLEMNVETPTFDDLGSMNYNVSLIGGIYAGIFGAAWSTTYNIDQDVFRNRVTGLVAPSDDFSFFVTVDMDTVRTYTFGLTLQF